MIVTNIHGCTTSDTTTVCVGNPEAVCADGIDVFLNQGGTTTLLPSQANGGSLSGNCSELNSLTLSHSLFTCADQGQQPVTLTVKDNAGCESSCTLTVSVQDTTPPDAACESLENLVLVWAGTEVYPSAMATQTDDNCGQGGLQYSFSPDFSSPSMTIGCREQLQGMIEMTVYVRDAAGNTSMCLVDQLVPPHPESETCDCDSEHLELGDQIPADDYKASGTIVSSGQVASGDTVMLKAAELITLQPGFKAVAGSYFAARIDSCGAVTESEGVSQQEISPESRAEETLEQKDITITNLETWPNPFSDQLTVSFELTKSASIDLFLSTMHGGPASMLLSGVQMAEGNHQLTVNGSRLPAGVYVLTLKAGDETEIARVLKIH